MREVILRDEYDKDLELCISLFSPFRSLLDLNVELSNVFIYEYARNRYGLSDQEIDDRIDEIEEEYYDFSEKDSEYIGWLIIDAIIHCGYIFKIAYDEIPCVDQLDIFFSENSIDYQDIYVNEIMISPLLKDNDSNGFYFFNNKLIWNTEHCHL